MSEWKAKAQFERSYSPVRCHSRCRYDGVLTLRCQNTNKQTNDVTRRTRETVSRSHILSACSSVQFDDGQRSFCVGFSTAGSGGSGSGIGAEKARVGRPGGDGPRWRRRSVSVSLGLGVAPIKHGSMTAEQLVDNQRGDGHQS